MFSNQADSDRSSVESLEPRALFSVPGPSPLPPPVPVAPLDGTGNNVLHPTWGKAGTDLLRLAPAAYGDGISSPAGANRPSARALSNALSAQAADLINTHNMSDYVYVFGQFLDHDIDLTSGGAGESFNVSVPAGDPWFDPTGSGNKAIYLTRSKYDPATGTGAGNPRQQVNDITSFIDGSQIYGSDATRAAALRTFVGGRLKTGAGNLLPRNTLGLANANDAHIVSDAQLFLAGDVRANENIELTALQTVFVREHNRIATQIAARNRGWTDEQIYQGARRMVIAELQSITVNEFLPALLGPAGLRPYRGYNPNVNPSIATEFSTAAFRFGHSMLDGEIGRLNNDGTETPQGSVELRNAFFNPTLLDPTLPNHQGDIDPFLKAASSGNAQDIDLKVVDDVRNFLFGPPGSGGLDLVSLNIQRGRDHGLADYNSVRAAYGLPKVTTFAQITSDPAVQSALRDAYGSVDNIDLWVGGLAEGHAPGASVGPLFARIISDQFQRLRDGDRFWFENTFRGPELGAIEHTTLSDIIMRNTSLTTLQPDVFLYYGDASPVHGRHPVPPIPPLPGCGGMASPPSAFLPTSSRTPFFNAPGGPKSLFKQSDKLTA